MLAAPILWLQAPPTLPIHPSSPTPQVHLAKLKGEKVVVKVQRPGLKDLFDIDLKNIRAIAVWLQKVRTGLVAYLMRKAVPCFVYVVHVA